MPFGLSGTFIVFTLITSTINVCPIHFLKICFYIVFALVSFQTFCTFKSMLCRMECDLFCYLLVDAPSSTKLISVPNNTTLLRKSNISLDCSTDANPEAHIYHFYLNDSPIGNSSSGVFNTTVMADGVYTCVPINTVGTGDNGTVSIIVVGKLTSIFKYNKNYFLSNQGFRTTSTFFIFWAF